VKRGELWAKDMGKSELLLGKPLGNIWEQVGNTKILNIPSSQPILVGVLHSPQELSNWFL
jgi:hypothetical protein